MNKFVLFSLIIKLSGHIYYKSKKQWSESGSHFLNNKSTERSGLMADISHILKFLWIKCCSCLAPTHVKTARQFELSNKFYLLIINKSNYVLLRSNGNFSLFEWWLQKVIVSFTEFLPSKPIKNYKQWFCVLESKKMCSIN